jgi:uncharacterized membrane protein YgcG
MELHPDRLRQATEAVRRSSEETLKEVNRAYCVLGNEANRRKYDADWSRFNSPPKPVVEPAAIVFNSVKPGEERIGSFVIRNVGGAYSNIWFSDPDSWVTVTGYASEESDDELPLRVDIRAIGKDWGWHYAETITVRLDDVEALVRVRLHTKPAPASQYAKAAPPPPVPQPSGPTGWGWVLGVAAVIAVFMAISAIVDGSSGGQADTRSYPVYQPGSSGSNYIGSPQGSRGVQSGYPGSQPGYPGAFPGNPMAQPGYSDPRAGSPLNRPNVIGSQPRMPGIRSGSRGYQPNSSGARNSSSGFGSSSRGFGSGSSGFSSGSSGFGAGSSSYGGWR